MSTLALACQRRHINPALIILVLFLAGAGCLTVAVAQLVAVAGPVLLTVAVVGGLVWLWRAEPIVAVPLPVVGCLAAVFAVSPWFALGGLVWLARRTGGAR